MSTRRLLAVLSAAICMAAGVVAVNVAHSDPAAAAAPSAPTGSYQAVTPSRLLDTRVGTGAVARPVSAGGTVSLQVTGRGGVPSSGVSAVVLNVTVTQPARFGYVTVFGAGSSRPTASNVNFSAGETVPNLVVAPVGAGGQVELFNGSAGSVQLIADVSGYFLSGAPTEPGTFGAVAPSRLLDTRVGTGAVARPVSAGGTVSLQVTGRGGVPSSGVSAVVLNVTVTQPARFGYVTVFGAGSSRPTASNVNFSAGETVPNLVVAPVGAGGQVELFNGSAGSVQLIADVSGYIAYPVPLAITTSALHDGVAGLAYQQTLDATGGADPYTWTASGLPSGLALTTDGVLSGTPAATGTSTTSVTVTDSAGYSQTAQLALAVPTAVPAQCAGSCALLTPDGQTVQIPASRIGAITRDSTGKPTQVLLTGPAPTAGQILVLAPSSGAPTGLILETDAVTSNADGTSTVSVTPAGPADAYADGTVNAVGSPTTASATASGARPAAAAGARPRPAAAKPAGASRNSAAAAAPTASHGVLECNDGGVSTDLFGLDVTPTLKPTVAALWKHPFFGGGGIYVGTGGLDLFQFDLDGSITVNLGVSISGAATCTLPLPAYTSVVPAGNLGAVILNLAPTLTLKVTGKVNIRTSVTLRCGAEYRWDQGQEYRVSYCQKSAQPLQLSADSGIDATVTGAIDASVTLDDIVGVTGNLTAAVHTGYHPADHPLAEIDGQVTYDLGACLACLWNGSPAHVALVSGTLFDKTIATYDTAPPPAPSGPPAITTDVLPAGTVGQPYAAVLTTSDNRDGTWSISAGSLPDGLTLADNSITGKPTTPQVTAFDVTFDDASGQSTTRAESITVTSGGSDSGGGAIQNAAYCRQNILPANDDNSTDAVALPFPVTFGGTSYASAYVSNNGYIVFDGPRGTYTPFPLADEAPTPIIAPFFADVDTRDPASALVTYGASPDGQTFCVDWVNVGYYNQHADKFDSFQLLLTNRSTVSAGDFDITFNYGHLTWETGDASGGTGGVGGIAARAGYSAGIGDPGTSLELPGSGVSGGLLDSGSNALIATTNVGLPGRDVYPIRN